MILERHMHVVDLSLRLYRRSFSYPLSHIRDLSNMLTEHEFESIFMDRIEESSTFGREMAKYQAKKRKNFCIELRDQGTDVICLHQAIM